MTDRHQDTNEPDAADVVESDAPTDGADRPQVEPAAESADDRAALDEEPTDADELEVDDEPEERVERRSDVVIVTLVFVVLFGYQLYAAVSNLVALPEVYAQAGISGAVPWVVLVANVAAPAVAFAAASAVARGRRLAARAGILLLGFAVSAQLSLLCEELARQAAAAAFAH